MQWTWRPSGDRALLIEWRGDIDEAAAAVRALAEALSARIPAGLDELVPGYVTLLLYYNPLVLPWDDLIGAVRGCAGVLAESEPPGGQLIEVPVLYGGAVGPDLPGVAELLGLDPGEVIALHSRPEYRVQFLGFVPGFAYMGRLPEALRVPRLARPRQRVPAGSVGIAGEQTGVYPTETPGGWRIIGRTPIPVYDAFREPRALFRTGDRVRFRPVGAGEYEEILRQVCAGRPPRHTEAGP